MHTVKRTLAGLAVATSVAAAGAAPSAGDLASRYSSDAQRAGQLQSTVQADTQRIQGYEGTIGSLQARLVQLQRTVAFQERLLGGVRSQLDAARGRLAALEAEYARGRVILADELRTQYETPPPTLVGVIVSSQGFDELLNGLNDLRAIERQNARVIELVRGQRLAVAGQAQRLAVVQERRQRAATSVLVQRDQIAQLRLSIVRRELATARNRSQAAAQLDPLRRRLTKEAEALEAQAAAAESASSGGGGAAPAGCLSSPFVPHGGPYGFFPAPGTNYTVNEEPVIAARLDALGRALGLHLIGISGYRSPEHSVEVGGFADDPHTRGEASDTPGVEGVPEATLERFCLTRPFPGPREADHIQEL